VRVNKRLGDIPDLVIDLAVAIWLRMGLLNTRTRYVARPKPACRVVYHLSRLPSRYGFPINGCLRGGRNLAAFDTVTPPLSVQGRPRYR
jgi:hypothetical protein